MRQKRGETIAVPPLIYYRIGDSEIPYNYSGILILPVLLRLQHIDDIEHFTSLCLIERVDEVLEVRLVR